MALSTSFIVYGGQKKAFPPTHAAKMAKTTFHDVENLFLFPQFMLSLPIRRAALTLAAKCQLPQLNIIQHEQAGVALKLIE